MPFSTRGTTVLFEIFHPSLEQLETCQQIVLTSDREWCPHSVDLDPCDKQGRFVATISVVERESERRRNRQVESEPDLVLGSVSGDLVPDTLMQRLAALVKIPASAMAKDKRRPHRKRQVNKVVIGTRHSKVTTERIADVMGIGIEKAMSLMKCST